MQSMLSSYACIDTLLPSTPTLPCPASNLMKDLSHFFFRTPQSHKFVARNKQRLFVVGRQLELWIDNGKMNCTRFQTTAFFPEIYAQQPVTSQHSPAVPALGHVRDVAEYTSEVVFQHPGIYLIHTRWMP